MKWFAYCYSLCKWNSVSACSGSLRQCFSTSEARGAARFLRVILYYSILLHSLDGLFVRRYVTDTSTPSSSRHVSAPCSHLQVLYLLYWSCSTAMPLFHWSLVFEPRGSVSCVLCVCLHPVAVLSCGHESTKHLHIDGQNQLNKPFLRVTFDAVNSCTIERRMIRLMLNWKGFRINR
jgi:hypothetical protein